MERTLKIPNMERLWANLASPPGMVLTANKLNIEEEVPFAPLIGPDQKLTEKAKRIFNEWFNLYSNADGKMTKETCC
jgi:hypothetical protein